MMCRGKRSTHLLPTSFLGTMICFCVYGMSMNVKVLSARFTSHTVRLVPSMAMYLLHVKR